FAELALNHVGQDSRAQSFDSAHGVSFAMAVTPLFFKWIQKVIEQDRESFADPAGLRCVKVFDFFQRKQRMPGFDDSVTQWKMNLRLPGKAGFDLPQNGPDRRGDIALEEIANE